MNILILLLASCITVPEAPTPNLSTNSDKTAQTVVLLGLRPVGVSQAEADTLNSLIGDFLGSRSEIQLLTRDELDAMVEHIKAQDILDCVDQACMANVARLANAALALSGSLGKLGQEYILTLNLIDSSRAMVVGNSSLSLSSLDDAASALPSALLEVFGWGTTQNHKTRYTLPEGRAVSFAVLDLKAQGVSENVVTNLTQVLAAELKNIAGTTVIGRDDIVAMLELEAQKERTDCSDVACLAEIGGALGVDKLVIGSVGKLGENFVLSLKLVDVREVQVDSRVSESLQGFEEQLLWAMRHSLPKLLGIPEDTAPGILQLTADQAKAKVFLNNKEAGVLPIVPITQLKPGRHSLRLTKDGFYDWRSDFYIETGGITPLWASMTELPQKWYKRWWVWAAVGAVAATGAAIYANQALQYPESDGGVHPL